MTEKQDITATVFDKKGRILSYSKNSYIKTHSRMKILAEKSGCNENKIYLHAEVRAIIKALKVGVPYKISVERYYKNGMPALSKPCKICELAIKEAGIRVVEYTIG